jgi:WD40 repeat protein
MKNEILGGGWRLLCKAETGKCIVFTVVLGLCNSGPAPAQNQQYRNYYRLTHELTFRSAFSPDASKIAIIDGKTLHVVDLNSGKEIQLIKGHEFEVFAASFSPDGEQILAGDGNSFRLWNVRTGKQLGRFHTRNGNLSCLAFTPDGRFAISGHSYGSGVVHNPPFCLLFWNLRTGEEVMDRELARFSGQEHVNDVVISPNGKTAFCGRKDGTARLLDVASGKQLLRINLKHAESVESVAFSPDGNQVLIGVETGKVFVWKLGEPAAQYRLDGHKGAVYCVGYFPSGRLALSGGEDKTARLWDLQTGKELAKYSGLDSPVTSLIFSPDGKSAYVADGFGKWKRWKLPE